MRVWLRKTVLGVPSLERILIRVNGTVDVGTYFHSNVWLLGALIYPTSRQLPWGAWQEECSTSSYECYNACSGNWSNLPVRPFCAQFLVSVLLSSDTRATWRGDAVQAPPPFLHFAPVVSLVIREIPFNTNVVSTFVELLGVYVSARVRTLGSYAIATIFNMSQVYQF